MDQVLIEDATGTMTCLQFEELGLDRVAVPLAVIYVDHNVIAVDSRNMEDHLYLQSFAARYGCHYSRPGNGISHYVHLERFGRPGAVLVGADSHTTMGGALGMLAIGAGGLEVAVAMAGEGFVLDPPQVVGVGLRGALAPWVQAKDVILELLRRRGVRGGLGRVFEFYGEGAAALSVMERATICNMIVETGATTALFPSDERVRSWLEMQGRSEDFSPIEADEGCSYAEQEVVDLPALEPLIAVPHSPGNVVPVTEVTGTPVVQVCVGSSVNSAYEDLGIVGAVLRGRGVHPDVQMTVTPGSRQVLDSIARSGVYHDLVAAGARMLEPVCGPCIGAGQAPPVGRASVRTFNRNFPGRSGTPGDEVYLCSPATAAATALAGEITDPRYLGGPPAFSPSAPNPEIDDLQVVRPSPDDSRRVEVVRGPNVVPPPETRPVPAELEGRVLIVVGDDVSTGDMAPDGVLGMCLWGNIPECARHMFRRFDPGFHDRALAWGGGFIVGGHNYGQGSSREQAALSPLHLGVRAVVAKSWARIHRANLIAQGLLPLTFEREDDYASAREGDEWSIEGVRDAVGAGATRLVARCPGNDLELRMDLSPRERDILLVGGLLRFVKQRLE